MLVGFIYQNPATPPQRVDDFVSIMDKVNACDLSVVVLGDFNIDLLASKPLWGPLWHNTTESLGLTQIIKEPTRITGKSATLLDHIYTNNSSFIISSGTSDVSMSDHKPITCNISFKLPKQKFKGHTYILYRLFKHFDKEAYLTDLCLTDFSAVMNCTDPDNAASIFLDILLSTIDNHAPVRRKRVKQSTLPNWMTPEIKHAMTIRDKLKKKKHFDEYRKQRNKVTNLVRQAKRNYFQKLLSQNNYVSQIWRAMNEFTNKSRSRKIINRIIFNADQLNDYFSSVAESILIENNASNTNRKYTIPNDLHQFCQARLQASDSFQIPEMTIYDVVN